LVLVLNHFCHEGGLGVVRLDLYGKTSAVYQFIRKTQRGI